jgi:peptidylprolyl isomerase
MSDLNRAVALAACALLAAACKSEEATPSSKTQTEKTSEVETSAKPAPRKKKTIPAPDDVAAPPEGAKTTASGLAYRVLEEGEGGPKPGPKDTVEVHYTGWTTDGEMFDSSRTRGRPARFPLNGVIEGWTEGLQLMSVGEKTRFWIPKELAYDGAPGRPQGMLVFDVELLGMTRAPEDIPAPENVSGPPEDAERTESGLAYKKLKVVEGSEKPDETDRVKVHYTGWTTEGQMFDSSVQRKKPAVFPLDQVIPGWTEGVQLIGVGEKARLWIPEELAYKGQRGAPQGMLVFDVELLEIM